MLIQRPIHAKLYISVEDLGPTCCCTQPQVVTPGVTAELVLQVPHLPESLKGLGADGGWRYNATKTRMGQDFFRYMRTALVAVGIITKIDHMSGYATASAFAGVQVTRWWTLAHCMSGYNCAAALTCLLSVRP